MSTELLRESHVALYAKWVDMWSGTLNVAHEIISDEFVAHTSADAFATSSQAKNPAAVARWVQAIRERITNMSYASVAGPFVDGDVLAAYWRVSGFRDGRAFCQVGTDILRIQERKVVECLTLPILSR